MTPLLKEREIQRKAAREPARLAARQRLRNALRRHLPNQRVWLFGSIVHAEQFHERSDIDFAVEALPEDMSIYTLTALFEEEMGRPVDVVFLPESRLRDKILREGEVWIG